MVGNVVLLASRLAERITAATINDIHILTHEVTEKGR